MLPVLMLQVSEALLPGPPVLGQHTGPCGRGLLLNRPAPSQLPRDEGHHPWDFPLFAADSFLMALPALWVLVGSQPQPSSWPGLCRAQ